MFHRGDPSSSIPLPIHTQTARCVWKLLSIHNGKKQRNYGIYLWRAHTAPLTLNGLCVKNAIFQNTHRQKHNAKRCIYPRMANKHNLVRDKHTSEAAFISVAVHTHIVFSESSQEKADECQRKSLDAGEGNQISAQRAGPDNLPPPVNFSKLARPLGLQCLERFPEFSEIKKPELKQQKKKMLRCVFIS